MVRRGRKNEFCFYYVPLKYYKIVITNNGSGFLTPPCEGLWSSYITKYGLYNGKLISPIYLKEVTTKNLKLNFTSSESTELRYNENIFGEYINGYSITYGTAKIDILTYLYDCFYPVDMGSNTCETPTLAQLYFV